LWLLVSSVSGSFRNPARTSLEGSDGIVENLVVLSAVVQRLRAAATRMVGRVDAIAHAMTRPAPMVVGLLQDLTRSRDDLLAENALLRQQLIVAARTTKRPTFEAHERGLMVLLARLVPQWRDAMLLVKPETILRWHREGFRLFWRWKSKPRNPKPNLPMDIITLIRRMAEENRLWGAERIRGELLKVGIRVAKRTVQRYMRAVRRHPPGGQTWATFLRNHRHQTWACDFLQVYDLRFRPIFAFFIIDLGSRRVVHMSVTREPTSVCVAQQMRNATPFGAGPRFIIRDRDDKYGLEFDRAARGAGARVLRTPVRAPRANAVCERFLGSVRRECLDHVLVLSERHLVTLLVEYCRYFNEARPHQGLHQLVPVGSCSAAKGRGTVVAFPVLRGLHHDYRRAA
jgi:transposase InsO family protein